MVYTGEVEHINNKTGGNSMEKKVEGIYDGFKELGTGKMLILGL